MSNEIRYEVVVLQEFFERPLLEGLVFSKPHRLQGIRKLNFLFIGL